MSGYGVFSQFYDALMHTVDYQKRAEQLRTLLVRYGVADGACVLDLGCGTAKLTLALAKLGYEMIGADASPDMLSEARQNLYDAAEAFPAAAGILLLCQPAEALDLYGTVDAAVSTLDVINHLDGAAAVRKAFANVGLFMNPGGVFVFDANTVHKHRRVLADHTFVYENDAVYCVWQNALQEDDSVEITLDFFERTGSAYRRSTETFTEYAYTTAQLTQWLREAQFEPLAILDGDDGGPLREDAERMVIAARYFGKEAEQ